MIFKSSCQYFCGCQGEYLYHIIKVKRFNLCCTCLYTYISDTDLHPALVNDGNSYQLVEGADGELYPENKSFINSLYMKHFRDLYHNYLEDEVDKELLGDK